MKHILPLLVWLGLGVLLWPEIACADNCGSFSDCFTTLRAALAATIGIGLFAALLSFGLDLIPSVGTVKGLIETVTGRDLLTGEKLAVWERVLGIVPFGGALLGDTTAMMVRDVDRVGDMLGTARGAARAVARADDAVDATSQVVRAARERRRLEILEEFAEAQSRRQHLSQPEGTQGISHTPNPRTSGSHRPSDLLGAALERAETRLPGHHAHHIVPEGMPGAENARAILERADIGINDAPNGVWLAGTPQVGNPTGGAVHSSIHTPRYIEELTQRLTEAERTGTIPQTLEAIRRDIAAGNFPH